MLSSRPTFEAEYDNAILQDGIILGDAFMMTGISRLFPPVPLLLPVYQVRPPPLESL